MRKVTSQTKVPTSKESDSSKPEECLCPNCPYKGKVILLEYELQQMRERYWGHKRKKLTEEDSLPGSAKKRGAPLGHPGWFRKVGQKIDELILVTLKCCPKCHGTQLTRLQEFQDHVQEDIQLPQVKATCFRHYSYWCRDCEEVVEPESPPEELPKSYIGPLAKSLAVWLKYDIKISDRDLQRLFETLFHLKIVSASVAGFRKQLARHGISIYAQIQTALRSSSVVHSDETGWKVRGKKHCLWSLSNKNLSLVHIDPSHALQALKNLLGETFSGTLIVDFLSVYNRYKAKAFQRCLIHLLRELKKISEIWAEDPIICRYVEALKSWINQALSLAKQYKKRQITKKNLLRQKAKLQNQLQDFQFTTAQKKPLLRIKKRLARHQHELLTFLDHPGVDPDNNHAERQIRPNVLLRKITFGNDSPVGARNHSIFMSIIQTAKLNNRSPPEVLNSILLRRNTKENKLPLLGVGEPAR